MVQCWVSASQPLPIPATRNATAISVVMVLMHAEITSTVLAWVIRLVRCWASVSTCFPSIPAVGIVKTIARQIPIIRCVWASRRTSVGANAGSPLQTLTSSSVQVMANATTPITQSVLVSRSMFVWEVASREPVQFCHRAWCRLDFHRSLTWWPWCHALCLHSSSWVWWSHGGPDGGPDRPHLIFLKPQV